MKLSFIRTPIEGNKFIQVAAAGKNDFWRYFFTVILIGFGFLAGGIVLVLMITMFTGSLDVFSLPPYLFLAVNLFPFLIILAVLLFSIKILHRRTVLTLISPRGQFDWKIFMLSGVLWLIVAFGSDLLLSIFQPGNYVFLFEPEKFFPWLIVAVLLLPFQCAAEELFFRGYMTQGFGLSGNFWLAWLIPSISFGLLHSSNPEVGTYGAVLTLPLYIGIGLLLGWITLRSESLEMALGLHIANNMYSALLVTFPSSVLPAPALFRIQQYDGVASLLTFILMAVTYLILLEVLGRSLHGGLFRKPG